MRIFRYFFVFLFLAMPALAADVDGKWTGQVAGQTGGWVELTFNFKADGDKLTGALVSEFGERKIEDGKIEGNKLTFTIQTGQFPIYNRATIEGDTIHLIETINGDDLTVTLKRVK
jgi:hypothetical protein